MVTESERGLKICPFTLEGHESCGEEKSSCREPVCSFTLEPCIFAGRSKRTIRRGASTRGRYLLSPAVHSVLSVLQGRSYGIRKATTSFHSWGDSERAPAISE